MAVVWIRSVADVAAELDAQWELSLFLDRDEVMDKLDVTDVTPLPLT